MRMVFLIGLISLALSGCSSTVTLRHPQTRAIVKCGPYTYFGVFAGAAAARETKCIQDYQRQGYERVPE